MIEYRFILSQAMRYAIKRDNHLAPFTFVEDAKPIIEAADPSEQPRIIHLLKLDLEREFTYPDLRMSQKWEYRYVWEEFYNWLKEWEATV